MAVFSNSVSRRLSYTPGTAEHGTVSQYEFIVTGEYTLKYTRKNEPMETLRVKLNIIDTGYKTMPVAKRTTSGIHLNGKSIQLSAFYIDGYNYVRLRDLAPVLNGSAKQFEIKRVVLEDTTYITSGMPFTISDIKLPIGPGEEKTALPFSVKTDIDGREIIFDSYLLDGFNFIKLRDIATALNFGVSWDDAQNRITINTTQSYAE